MKILLFSDVHWSATTSIVRSVADQYTTRLQLLLESMNWVNDQAVVHQCDFMICAGDFFDRTTINDLELTALKDIKWNNLPCYFLVGNHESSVADLHLNLLKALENEKHIIVDTPEFSLNVDDCVINFLPYIVDPEKKPLLDYFTCFDSNKRHIIISHNDLAGIQYGKFLSTAGFSIDEITQTCDLYLNGHLHNSEKLTDKILNLGSLSAHNFTNDSFKYKYGAWVLDTETLQLSFLENPYSLNFYKIIIEQQNDFTQLANLKQNAVVAINCKKDLIDELKNKFDADYYTNIIVKKLVTIFNYEQDNLGMQSNVTDLYNIDHVQRFIDFCHEKLGTSKCVDDELYEICLSK